MWKVKSKDYFNRNKKNAALEKIVGALKKLKPDFSVKQLKQKINVLRTNFNREFKTIEGKKVSGTSTDDIPEPSLWYYNDMYFIKDQLEIAQTETSEVRILFHFYSILNYFIYRVMLLLIHLRYTRHLFCHGTDPDVLTNSQKSSLIFFASTVELPLVL